VKPVNNQPRIVWVSPSDILGGAQAGWFIGEALADLLQPAAADDQVICVGKWAKTVPATLPA
jgi:hypothetical protein